MRGDEWTDGVFQVNSRHVGDVDGNGPCSGVGRLLGALLNPTSPLTYLLVVAESGLQLHCNRLQPGLHMWVFFKIWVLGRDESWLFWVFKYLVLFLLAVFCH